MCLCYVGVRNVVDKELYAVVPRDGYQFTVGCNGCTFVDSVVVAEVLFYNQIPFIVVAVNLENLEASSLY